MFLGNEIDITVDMSPSELRTAQQKGVVVKNGRPMFFVKKDVAAAEAKFRAALVNALNEISWTPFAKGAPLYLQLNFCYPSSKQLDDVRFKTTRPDCDNLAKGVIDRLQDVGIFEDDAQIVCLGVRKYYAESDGYIRIRIGVKKNE